LRWDKDVGVLNQFWRNGCGLFEDGQVEKDLEEIVVAGPE
jgi:hypothetical protein